MLSSPVPLHPSAGGSAVDVDLLAPPKSPSLPEDSPFIPPKDDNTSLSMKTDRHAHRDSRIHGRHKPKRMTLSSEVPQGSSPKTRRTGLYHSRSLPTMSNPAACVSAPKTNFPSKSAGWGTADQAHRRWTLPCKALATRSRNTTIVADYRPATTTPPPGSGLPSPAMITLRRATTLRSVGKISLTFFPEPKFTRSMTGSLLTAFLRTITGMPGSTQEAKWPSVEQRKFSQALVERDGAHPCCQGSAPTVCTMVATVQPIISQPDGAQHDTKLRRCSTKYTSSISQYEVLWYDENISSTSISPPAQVDRRVSGVERRRSVAIDLLEKQLTQASNQTGRRSEIQQQSRPSSVWQDSRRERQDSLQSILNFKLSRFVNEAALQNLPRSRASRIKKITSAAAVSRPGGVSETSSDASRDCDVPLCGLEVSPLLRSAAATASTQKIITNGSALSSTDHVTSPVMSWGPFDVSARAFCT